MGRKPSITLEDVKGTVLNFTPAPKKPRKSHKDKWTDAVIDYGYCSVPSLLLQAQGKLKLSAEQFNILMQLADFWWDANDPPHPSKETLARRTGMGERQIQRHLAALEKQGFLQRIERFRGKKNQTSNGYLLTGLVDKLKAVEPDFRIAREQNRLRKKKVETGSS